MTVTLITVTPNAEKIIGHCARVSNPANQKNPDVAKLLAYCVRNKHWSIFEMANMVLEIKTSRAISPQILRHRSFSFQEFSQRYAKVAEFENVEWRAQDPKNRQNSTSTMSPHTKRFLDARIRGIEALAMGYYHWALTMGVAKECARFLLPMSASTRLYMNGTVRSWIHYIQLRTEAGTQKEHRDIALAAKAIFVKQFPLIAKALEWK